MPRGVKGSGKAAQSIQAAPPQAEPTQEPHSSSWRPLGSVDVDSLSGQVLKDYAKRAGVRQHDIEALSEDRLRQNVKLVIANHFELLTE